MRGNKKLIQRISKAGATGILACAVSFSLPQIMQTEDTLQIKAYGIAGSMFEVGEGELFSEVLSKAVTFGRDDIITVEAAARDSKKSYTDGKIVMIQDSADDAYEFTTTDNEAVTEEDVKAKAKSIKETAKKTTEKVSEKKAEEKQESETKGRTAVKDSSKQKTATESSSKEKAASKEKSETKASKEKANAKSKASVKTESKEKASVKTKAASKATAKVKTVSKATAEAKTASKSKTASKTKAASKATAEAKTASKTKAASKATAEAKTASKSKTASKATAEAKTASKSKTVSKAKTAAKAAEQSTTAKKWRNKLMADVDDRLNIRKSAGEDSEIVGRLCKGDVAKVLKKGKEWTKITSGSVTGYVKNEYCVYGVKAYKLAKKVCDTYAVVEADGLRIRQKPSEKAKILDEVYEGDKLTVKTEKKAKDGWVVVNIDGQKGYVADEYVNVALGTGRALSIEEEMEQIKAEQKAQEEESAAQEEQAMSASSGTVTSDSTVQANSSDLTLLSAIIFCEAGGESYAGQVAVGAVVMNRVNSGSFPNSISGVVYQSGQFSPVANGSLSKALSNGNYQNCMSAAREALAGSDNTGGAKFFHRVNGDAGLVIGNHVFY